MEPLFGGRMEIGMLVRLENVKKTYKDFTLDCSLQVEEGRITGIIGQNGAGKSTTYKAMLGLIQAEGRIEMFDKPVKNFSEKDKEEIGVVLAESGFSSYLMVKDLIPIMQNMYASFHKEQFIRNCERFHIPLDKKMKEFSTGMKAKLKVLIAISHDAKLLLLDEPTSGLDVVVREEVLDMLREYMETEGRGIMISSHISSDLESICDDIYMIHNGKVILHEDTNVLLDEYGVLKVTEEQLEGLDKSYLIKTKKEIFGYCCLTSQKQFYQENYPEIAIEKGNIDQIILLMSQE